MRAALIGAILIFVMEFGQAFIAPALPVRGASAPASTTMLFGGGAKRGATKKGIAITVQQKTGFKEMTVTIEKPANLRTTLLAQGVDIYPLQGKIYNCGGGGSCGTCAVEVVKGMENLNAQGPGEKKLLEKKLKSIRLACCARVSGDITIKTKP